MNDLLAYVHPFWQGGAIALVLLTLRWGLSIRRTRLRQGSEPRGSARRKHVRAGVVALSFVVVGHAVGVLSMAVVRNEPIFRSAHAYVGTAATALFLLGGYYGWRLKKGGPDRESARELHVFCVGLALFLALVGAVMGYGILP